MRSIDSRQILPFVILILVIAVKPAGAQESGASEAVSTLDGVYTEDQADRGRTIFDRNCAGCHAPREFSASSFLQSWEGARIYDLYYLIRATMPADNPGGLEPEEYAAVLARFLELNDLPAGSSELGGEEALKGIRIERAPTDADGGG